MKKILLPVIAMSLVCLTSCGSQEEVASLSLTLKQDEFCYVYRVSFETSYPSSLNSGLAFSYSAGSVINQYDQYFTIKSEQKLTYYSNSYWGYYISTNI